MNVKVIVFNADIIYLTVAAHSKVNGRMASDTAWAWKRVTAGCTVASGRRGTRAATACARAPSATPSTRAPGPMDSKTDMAPKHTQMAVSIISFLSLPNYWNSDENTLRLHGHGILR